MEQFKVGDLVEYNQGFAEDSPDKGAGLVIENSPHGFVLVRWFNHPHADVIGDELGYACFELKRATTKENKVE